MMSERRDSLHDGDDGDHVLQFMGIGSLASAGGWMKHHETLNQKTERTEQA